MKTSKADFNIATCMVLCEFDIDKGATMRTYHESTKVPAYRLPMASLAEFFAHHMLPDGAEKTPVGRTVFMVNRPQIPRCARYPVYRFTCPVADVTAPLHTWGWSRPAEDGTGLTTAQTLVYNLDRSDTCLSLRFRGRELWSLPEAPTPETIVRAEVLPPAVAEHLTQLERQLVGGSKRSNSLVNDSFTLDSSNPGGNGGSPGGGAGGFGSSTTTHEENFTFIYIRPQESTEPAVGFLLQHSHLNALLRNIVSGPLPSPSGVIPGSLQREFDEAAAAAAGESEVPQIVVNAVSAPDLDSATGSGTSEPFIIQAQPATQQHHDADDKSGEASVHQDPNQDIPPTAPGGEAVSFEPTPLAPLEEVVQQQTGATASAAAEGTPAEASAAEASAVADSAAAAPPATTPAMGGFISSVDNAEQENVATTAPPAATAADAATVVDAAATADSDGERPQPPTPSNPLGADDYSAAAAEQVAMPTPPTLTEHHTASRASSRSHSSSSSPSSSADGRTGESHTTRHDGGSNVLPANTPEPHAVLTKVVNPNGEVLYGLCAVFSKKDSSVRRGGITKSVAALGPSLAWLEMFFPVLVEAAQYCCDIPGSDEAALRQQIKVLKSCAEAINAASPALASALAGYDRLESEVSKYCTFSSARPNYVAVTCAPFNNPHKLRVPVSPSSHDVAAQTYSLEGLITAFGPAFMHLVLGVMTGKRIVFLSRQGKATDVCEASLSLGMVGDSVDPQFLAQKVFPYASVNSVEYFKDVSGYIIGTLNPIFSNEKAWGWDMLCELESRTVVLAGEKQKKPGFSSSFNAAAAGLVGNSSSGDDNIKLLPAAMLSFYKELVARLYHLRALRLSSLERNRAARLMLEEFIHTTIMTGQCDGATEVGGGANNSAIPPAVALTFTSPAMSAVRREALLSGLVDDVARTVLYPDESPAFILNTAALRRKVPGDEHAPQRTLQTLLGLLDTPRSILLLLRRMTLSTGGLNPIALHLTHPSLSMRVTALEILSRIETVPLGKEALSALNNFLLLVYEDAKKLNKGR